MIVGLGVDIAEVGRMKTAIERHGEAFLRRVYTAREREYCERFKNKYERYAGRFAAKEAHLPRQAFRPPHPHPLRKRWGQSDWADYRRCRAREE